MVTIDPADAALELLAAMQTTADRILQDLVEFRAETSARFGELRADLGEAKDGVSGLSGQLDTQGAKVDEHGVMLAEILRRLPPPADS